MPTARRATVTAQADITTDCRDALIAGSLSGQVRQWPEAFTEVEAKQLIERADFHGVSNLFVNSLQGLSGVPELLTSTLLDRRLSFIFWEDRHRHFVSHVINALTEAGISSIVFKGTACAYSIYSSPFERIRGDSDILIEASNRKRVHEILTSLGYHRGLTFARERGSGQNSYELKERLGWSHVIDLHWKINNSAVLSQIFTWDELWPRSQPLTSLCEAARSPALVDSLLISCFHRLAHMRLPYTVNGTTHYNADRLIWLCDINFLSRALSDGDWCELAIRARHKGLARACLSGLQSAHEVFGTIVPTEILNDLAESHEASAVDNYLHGNSSIRFCYDVLAQAGIGGKFAFVGEHLFPPPEYMRSYFGRGWLPALYLLRGIRGIVKRLSRDKKP